MRHAGDGTVGRLAVGFVPAAGNGVLPDILRRYQTTYPGVAPGLYERSPDDLIRQLHEHRVEVAFLFAPYHDGALHSRCISVQHLIAALPEGHVMARQPAIDVYNLVTGSWSKASTSLL